MRTDSRKPVSESSVEQVEWRTVSGSQGLGLGGGEKIALFRSLHSPFFNGKVAFPGNITTQIVSILTSFPFLFIAILFFSFALFPIRPSPTSSIAFSHHLPLYPLVCLLSSTTLSADLKCSKYKFIVPRLTQCYPFLSLNLASLGFFTRRAAPLKAPSCTLESTTRPSEGVILKTSG